MIFLRKALSFVAYRSLRICSRLTSRFAQKSRRNPNLPNRLGPASPANGPARGTCLAGQNTPVSCPFSWGFGRNESNGSGGPDLIFLDRELCRSPLTDRCGYARDSLLVLPKNLGAIALLPNRLGPAEDRFHNTETARQTNLKSRENYGGEERKRPRIYFQKVAGKNVNWHRSW